MTSKMYFALVSFSVGEKSFSACFLHWFFLVGGALTCVQVLLQEDGG